MTIGEVERVIKSKNRVKRIEEKERAAYDYILANMIARGVSAAIVGGDGIPSINEVYGSLFEENQKQKQDEKQNIRNELSVLRFKQYANFHNNKMKK